MKLLWTLVVVAGAAGAQEPCKVLTPDANDALVASPANHTVLFENPEIRVLDVHSEPHTREAVHTHRLPSVMYIERQGAGTYDTPDGSDHRSHPTDPNFKPRIFAIKPEGLHWTENTGEVPFHAIRVEFKHPGCGGTAWTPGKDDALVAAPGDHTLLFEDADVRVLDVRLAPHAKEPMHTDEAPSYFYVAEAAPLRIWSAGGKDEQEVRFPPEVKFLPLSLKGMHAFENTGDKPLHLIQYELKQKEPAQ